MKKLLSKTLAFVLVSLFALIFNSCEKTNKLLEGKTWSEYISFYDPPEAENYPFISQYDPGYFDSYSGRVTIEFTTKEEADVSVKFTVREYYYKYISESYGWMKSDDGQYEEIYKGVATYTCEGNDVSLRVKWKNPEAYDFDDGKWTGTVDNLHQMTLKNVFGKTVIFEGW